MLRKLLDNFLELQKILLSKSKEATSDLSDRADPSAEADPSSDEDIPSDFEDDDTVGVENHNVAEDDVNSVHSEDESGNVTMETRQKRKRKRREWVCQHRGF